MDTIRADIEDAINTKRYEVADETMDELRSYLTYDYETDDSGIIDTLRETADKIESLNELWSDAQDFIARLEYELN